jgi:hypothetical protein
MQIEHFALQLDKQEAFECLQALLTQTLIEEEIRSQKGLEMPELSPIITRLMAILGCDDSILENITEKSGDELWEYAWYAFTNEWAWHRAKQDALKEQKSSKKNLPSRQDYQKITERLYNTRFEKYVAELNMKTAKQNKSKS